MPPYIGFAEKVSNVPGQMVLDGETLMVTEGVCPDDIFIVIEFDKAGLFDTQDKLEVIKH